MARVCRSFTCMIQHHRKTEPTNIPDSTQLNQQHPAQPSKYSADSIARALLKKYYYLKIYSYLNVL